jgi:hypothetical protein
MATCITCDDELDPERAEKYEYCTKPECRERNARGLQIVAVGVNKAADQFVTLNERTKEEMAAGRYKKQPEAPRSSRRTSRTGRTRKPGRAPVLVPRSPAGTSDPRWSEAQENLTLIYRDMGLKPIEIARRLGVSVYLVTQILLGAQTQGKRRKA